MQNSVLFAKNIYKAMKQKQLINLDLFSPCYYGCILSRKRIKCHHD